MEFTSIDEEPLDQDAFDENGAEAGDQPRRPPLRANRNTVQCWRSSSAPRNSCAGCRAAAWWTSCNAIATAWNRPPASTRGSLHTLSDGGSLILFHSRDNRADYLTNALCCGELMRALGHALQIEVADSGITCSCNWA